MGRPLNQNEAKTQHDVYWSLMPDPKLPHAVCYTLKEVSDFYMAANKMLADCGVPEKERGVALVLGVNLDQSQSYAKNKPTIMMVATQFTDNVDPTIGRVDAINNPTMKAGWTAPIPPDIGDVALDAGGLWP